MLDKILFISRQSCANFSRLSKYLAEMRSPFRNAQNCSEDIEEIPTKNVKDAAFNKECSQPIVEQVLEKAQTLQKLVDVNLFCQQLWRLQE